MILHTFTMGSSTCHFQLSKKKNKEKIASTARVSRSPEKNWLIQKKIFGENEETLREYHSGSILRARVRLRTSFTNVETPNEFFPKSSQRDG